MVTERIRLGTGVVPIYTRTPATMAQTAATLNALSDGRHILGLGVSHRPTVEHWYGQTIDKPLAEMREYVAIVRAVLAGETPPEGAKWKTSFALRPELHAPELPIYVSGLSPRMLELAGEIGAGVVLWLCNPDYIRDVVVPAVTAGREKAGKSLEDFDIVAAVPSGLTDDPDATLDIMRADLIPYFGLPFYRAMLERSGFGADIAAYDDAAGRGDFERMKAAISTDFLRGLCAVGDESDIRAGIARYAQAGATTPALGPIPKTDFEATLRAGAASG
jgi:alkanesulfonate monooxygenase SsuD/methylene tetrahydromethanopterin reductase-like flavin-dependent oxidoreductase (luciferase family)